MSTVIGGTVCSADQKLLTLSEAARIMMEHNPALSQKSLEKEKAERQLQGARGSYLPSIDFVQSWNRSDNPVYVFGSLLNQGQFTESNFAIPSLNHPAPLTDISYRFEMGWLLYDFGRREYRIDNASTARDVAALQQQTAANTYLQELVRRYYAVSLASTRIKVADESVSSATARRDQAAQRLEQGMVVQTDVLSAEVHAARMREEKINAENAYRLSLAALKELIGVSENQEIITAPLEDKTIFAGELTNLISQMKENRPELQLAAKQKEISESQAKIQRADFLPSLEAWSAYEWHGESHDYTGNNWGAGIQLKWNLFNGFSDSTEFASARLDSKIASEKQRELENALLLQLQSSYFGFQSAVEKRKVAAAALEYAKENRRIFADRYEGGFATIQDTLQAESEYSTAHLNYLENLYDISTSYADLLTAAGRTQDILLLETNSPIPANERQDGAK